MTTFQVGDKVTIDHPRFSGTVYTVAQQLPKNYRVQDANGVSVRVSPALLRPASDLERPLGVPYVEPVTFSPGQTVKLRGKPGVFVVTKSTPRGYSVAVLGGDNGRYWNAPVSNLTAVKITFEETSS